MKPAPFRLLRLSALLFILSALAMACVSGGSKPAANAGANAPTGLSLLIYRDTLGNAVFAESLPGERYWKFTGEREGEFLVAVDCTRDGQSAAYLTASNVNGTSLKISGQPDSISLPREALGLAWAPDGSRIAITAFDATSGANRLQLVDPHSGEVTVVASGRGSIGPPRWSPDGTRIAFDVSEGVVNQVYIYALGTQGAAKLKDRGTNSFSPDWSPDGSTLVFGAPAQSGVYQLFRMNSDGTRESQLTNSNVSHGRPRWSPDGSLIAYAGTFVVPSVSMRPAALHNLAVYTMKPDGTDERAVTDPSTDSQLDGWCLSGPWLAEDWQETDVAASP